MDSIRPDEDELRADAPISGEVRKTGQGKKGRREDSGGGGKRPPPPSHAGKSGGSSGGLVWTLLLLLVVVVSGTAWFGWQMHRQLQTMESQVEEADYWARQSKLALARFEGDLSETGENLQETGSSMDQRLDTIDDNLEEASSEIRKLWVLANEKNRPGIASLVEKQEGLAAQLGTLTSELEATDQRVKTLQTGTEDLSSTLDQTRQGQQQNDERLQSLASKVEDVNGRLGSIDQEVARQLQRFGQEQSLTLDGLESRIQALESGDGRLQELSRQLNATRSRLAEAEQTLRSVDASRAQLTSRLVRLQDQVEQLRAQ